jgi:hypothetical protein
MTPLPRAARLSLTSRVLALAAFTLTLQASCARSAGSNVDTDPQLAAPGTKNPAPLTVCVATDCPAPWATCTSGALCATNTSRDVDNCGGCGNACPKPARSFHASAVCADSKCTIACDELSADCNHQSADGCEISTGDDPNNCGACGNVCKAGDPCWKGACGCPKGFTVCDGQCTNLASDNLSCGACGKACVAPPSNDPAWLCGPDIQPPSTDWGCTGGGCKLVCKPSFGDCNGNLCSDGCETDERTDPKNCGACGNTCAAGQDCVDGTCICPPGSTRCGNRCVDLNVDVDNCGACGNGCQGASDDTANGSPTCTGGRCGYVCYPGFADCDKRINNGCEVDIGTDARHCGGCGTQCDRGRGQPCVLGQCLTKPCEPGAATK